MNLVGWLKETSVDEVLKQSEVAERINLMKENNAAFLEIIKENSVMDGNVVITDFRSVEKVPVGNRFLVYTLFPESNVSVRLQWGPKREFVATTLGHSIFNRTSKANCGETCSKFGGGGHKGAGAVPLKTDKADQQIAEIVQILKDSS
ncbi:MAG: hypothetical protein V3V59_07755 [Thermodesulfovibrionales bacterium]